MSNKLSTAVWKSSLTGNDLIIMHALADHGDDDGYNIWPSKTYTAWKANVSVKTVQRFLKRYVDLGILEVVEEAKQHYATHYRLIVEKLPAKVPLEDFKALNSRPPSGLRGDNLSPLNGVSEGTGCPPSAGNSTESDAKQFADSDDGPEADSGRTVCPPCDSPGGTNCLSGGTNQAPRGDTAMSPKTRTVRNNRKKGTRVRATPDSKQPDYGAIQGLNQEAWEAWQADRRRRNLRPYKTTREAQRLAALTDEQQMRCVEYSMDRYQGLIPDRFENDKDLKNARPKRQSNFDETQQRARERAGLA